VVTLGTGTLLYGLAYAVITGPIVGVPNSLVNFIGYRIGPFSVQFYVAVLLALAFWYVLGWTPLGRYVYVVGSSREVARLSGLSVNRIRAGSFLVAALTAALGGILLSGSTGGADPSTASSYLLEAFAAVFLGATAITPGRFNAAGTFVAVYFLTTGVTGLELRGLTGWVEQVFYGGALIAGVAASRLIGVVTKVSRT
jgi:ribose transport system permease protein